MKGVLAPHGTVAVRLREHDDPELHRLRYDPHRLRSEAPKWERHLSSTKAGLAVRVQRPGSRYEDCQAPAPYQDWRLRLQS